MNDDMSKNGFEDRSRVNVNDDNEVRYWTGQFGCSSTELRAAVTAVGDIVGNVEQELKRKK